LGEECGGKEMITQKNIIRFGIAEGKDYISLDGTKGISLETLKRLREQLKKKLGRYANLASCSGKGAKEIVDDVLGVEAKK
jgi:hypothetical protein